MLSGCNPAPCRLCSSAPSCSPRVFAQPAALRTRRGDLGVCQVRDAGAGAHRAPCIVLLWSVWAGAHAWHVVAAGPPPARGKGVQPDTARDQRDVHLRLGEWAMGGKPIQPCGCPEWRQPREGRGAPVPATGMAVWGWVTHGMGYLRCRATIGASRGCRHAIRASAPAGSVHLSRPLLLQVVANAICPERSQGYDNSLTALASVTEVYVSNDLQVRGRALGGGACLNAQMCGWGRRPGLWATASTARN